MSALARARAVPSLLRVAFAESIAYRANFFVWVLTTTMPLIMLALWSAVARDAPVGRFGQAEFTSYFLATFVVRQLTMAWVAWEMNFEIREGAIVTHLLRPISPAAMYALENLAYLPLRLLIVAPVAAVGLWYVGPDAVTHDPVVWLAWCVAVVGGWLLGFTASFAIGCLAFRIDSSIKVMDLWLVLFFVFGGYLFPVELFPGPLRVAADVLPFRYQQALPVELMTGAHDVAAAWTLVGRQWIWVAVSAGVAALLWRDGVKRYAAFGG